jgi:hypothetical protein
MLLQMIFEFGPLWLVAFHAPPGLYGPVTAGLVSALGFGGLLAGRVRFEHPAVVTFVVAVLLARGFILVAGSSAARVTPGQRRPTGKARRSVASSRRRPGAGPRVT